MKGNSAGVELWWGLLQPSEMSSWSRADRFAVGDISIETKLLNKRGCALRLVLCGPLNMCGNCAGGEGPHCHFSCVSQTSLGALHTISSTA